MYIGKNFYLSNSNDLYFPETILTIKKSLMIFNNFRKFLKVNLNGPILEICSIRNLQILPMEHYPAAGYPDPAGYQKFTIRQYPDPAG